MQNIRPVVPDIWICRNRDFRTGVWLTARMSFIQAAATRQERFCEVNMILNQLVPKQHYSNLIQTIKYNAPYDFLSPCSGVSTSNFLNRLVWESLRRVHSFEPIFCLLKRDYYGLQTIKRQIRDGILKAVVFKAQKREKCNSFNLIFVTRTM
jgi:hypothetical protein